MAIIIVQPGVSQTFGTSGDDVFIGSNQADYVIGLEGNDSIVGRDGNDTLAGNLGDDTIDGEFGNDIILGGQGNDVLVGGVGNDQIFGNKGDDYLFGSNGDDTIRGGQGDDQLSGENGNDVLYGDIGNDTFSGGTGRDVFVIARGMGADIITDFVKGEDLIGLDGFNFPDLRIVQDGVNSAATIFSGNGETLVTLQNFNSVLDRSDFTTLLNSIGSFSTSDVPPTPVLPAATGNLGIVIDRLNNNSPYFADGRSTFTRNLSDPREATIENFQAGNDVLQLGDTGPFAPELLQVSSVPPNGIGNVAGTNSGTLRFNYNGSGQTTVTGLTSAPTPNQIKLGTVNPPSIAPTGAFGAVGTFTQTGSLIIGSGVIDASSSVGGNDVIIVNNRNSSRVIAGPGNDSISGSEAFDPQTGLPADNFASASDTVSGGDGNDTIRGNIGNDSISGDAGNDLLDGGDGDDTLLGGAGDDTLLGGAGDDLLDGGTGNNVINSGGGNDTLIGGIGRDTLIGGGGINRFVLSSVGGRLTTINDLTTSDVIVLDPAGGLTFDNTVISSSGSAGQNTTLSSNGVIFATLLGVNADDLSSINFTNSIAPGTPASGSGEVGIFILDGSASESNPGAGISLNTGVFEVRRTGSTAAPLVVELAIGGTAINGVDYNLVDNRLTIPAGQNSAFITIVPIEEAIGEQPPETIQISLVRAPNYRISPTDAAKSILLLDSPDATGLALFNGTPVDDIASGSAFGDRLNGAGGNDILNGGAGDDSLGGDSGNDVLRGDAGDDILNGGTGTDTLNGGEGDDTLNGGPGNDVLTGGLGADRFVISAPGDGVDTITDFIPLGQLTPPLPVGQPVPPTVAISSGDLVVLDSNTFVGLSAGGNIAPQQFQSANNLASIQAQSTTRIVYLRDSGRLFYTPNGVTAGSLGANTLVAIFSPISGDVGIQGAPDIKASDIQVSGTGTVDTVLPTVTIAPTDPIASEANGKTATFTVTRTGATTAPLTIFFNTAPTTTPAQPTLPPTALPTDTAIFGVDYVLQPQGFITIPAGSNSATIQAFPIADGIGESANGERFTINITPPSGYAVINQSATGFIFDTAVNLSLFPGTDGADRITGTPAVVGVSPGNDLILGGAGNDVLIGLTGDDTISGGQGNDDIRGRDAQNTGLSVGISDNDLLFGGPGVDTINGDVGNDTIVGGTGADVLFGGGFGSSTPQVDNQPISNRFVYNFPGEGGDTIGDFIPDAVIDRTPFFRAPFTNGPTDIGVPFGAEDSFVQDAIVLNAGGFGLTVSNTILPSEFQRATNFAGIVMQPTARILYISGTVGANGLVYYAPNGVDRTGALPTGAVLLAQLTSPIGLNGFGTLSTPFLTATNFQVIPNPILPPDVSTQGF
jgi:Ca2+-binding RTX toxin-like protein